jgi:hypothetical protein
MLFHSKDLSRVEYTILGIISRNVDLIIVPLSCSKLIKILVLPVPTLTFIMIAPYNSIAN